MYNVSKWSCTEECWKHRGMTKFCEEMFSRWVNVMDHMSRCEIYTDLVVEEDVEDANARGALRRNGPGRGWW